MGASARTRLHETKDFVDMKTRCKNELEEAKEGSIEEKALLFGSKHLLSEKINLQTTLAYFLISCGFPACFYCSFIHLAQELKINFNYSADDILHHNLVLSVCYVSSFLVYSFLCYKVHPIQILKFRAVVFMLGILFSICSLGYVMGSPHTIFWFQFFIMCFGVMDVPASAICINYFPVSKKYTSIGLIYAFSRMMIYITTSFGMTLFTNYFHDYGIFFVLTPVGIGYAWGTYYFDRLEGCNRKVVPEIKENNVFYFEDEWKKRV